MTWRGCGREVEFDGYSGGQTRERPRGRDDLGAGIAAEYPHTVANTPRSLSIVARIPVDLADVYLAEDKAFCDTLDRCREASLFLLDRAGQWLGED